MTRYRTLSIKSARNRDQSGQAIVEFLFCAITFLFVLLGTLQLVLVLNAQIAVNYASYSAARAAIVSGCGLAPMQIAARMALAPIFPRHGRAATARGYMDNFSGANSVDTYTQWWGIEGQPITKVEIVSGLTRGATTTFDDPFYGTRTAIKVRVVHQYELIMPLVNAILFKTMELGRQNKIRGRDIDAMAKQAMRSRILRTRFSGYRIPLVSTYTMHLQSDCNGG